MSTQDTTLPPLPDFSAYEKAFAAELEFHCLAYARAAIAAQAPQPASPEDVAVYQSIADNYKASISQPEPKTAALWATFDEATADPLFHQARAIMGTANLGQDQALRQAILHVLGAVAQPQKAPADWLHLKPYGYAPGKYMSRCSDCGQTPTMDKRATRCRPCAEAAFIKTQQAQQAQGVPDGCVQVDRRDLFDAVRAAYVAGGRTDDADIADLWGDATDYARRDPVVKAMLAAPQPQAPTIRPDWLDALEDRERLHAASDSEEDRQYAAGIRDAMTAYALAAAPQAEPQPEREPLTATELQSLCPYVASSGFALAWTEGAAMAESACANKWGIKLAGIGTKGAGK